MARQPAPFRVEREGDGWSLIMLPDRLIARCRTQAEAIEQAYKQWPYWP